jgi:hypothetical protein
MNELTGFSSGYALSAYSCANISISNSNFDDSGRGIHLVGSTDFTGYNLSLSVRNYGFKIIDSENTRLEGSIISGSYGTLEISMSSGDIINNNTIRCTSYRGVVIDRWYDSIFTNNFLTFREYTGISFTDSNRCEISHSIIKAMSKYFGTYGMQFQNVSNFTVENNILSVCYSLGIGLGDL